MLNSILAFVTTKAKTCREISLKQRSGSARLPTKAWPQRNIALVFRSQKAQVCGKILPKQQSGIVELLVKEMLPPNATLEICMLKAGA